MKMKGSRWELGPMHVVDRDSGEAAHYVRSVRVAGAMPVEVVVRLDFGYGSPQDAEVASLIGVAPALLEALREVLPLAERWAEGNARSHPDHDKIRRAFEAIKQAEGTK
jgi:hypothetical protein